MKTTLHYFSILLFLTAIISSCSVQKRRYNKGWHVEWASSHTKTDKKTAEQPAIKTYQAKSLQSNTESLSIAAPETVKTTPPSPVITAEAKTPAATNNSTKEKAVSTPSSPQPGSSFMNAVKAGKYKAIDTYRRMNDTVDDGTDTLGILSFIFAIVGLFTGIGFLLALIFGSIALNRYRAGRGNPDRKIFATLGYIIGLIGLIVYLVILLLLLLLVW